jgi:hypothetical protein
MMIATDNYQQRPSYWLREAQNVQTLLRFPKTCLCVPGDECRYSFFAGSCISSNWIFPSPLASKLLRSRNQHEHN